MKLTPERLQRMAEQVSPGPKAGGGLKLARSIGETPSVVVSPGPKAGGGLKRSAQVIHDNSAIVSPGPKAGGGWKLEGGA